jgi:diguanylate cyclase (GGDEF)-like protein
MQASAGANEIVCRWGGDEFLVIAPDCTLDEAAAKAARIQSNTLGQYLLEAGDKVIRTNVSAGAGIAQHRPGETAEALFERVDRLLYEDKRRADRRGPSLAPERSRQPARPSAAPARL